MCYQKGQTVDFKVAIPNQLPIKLHLLHPLARFSVLSQGKLGSADFSRINHEILLRRHCLPP